MSTSKKKTSNVEEETQQVSVFIDRSQYVPHLLNILNNRISSGASDLYIKRFGVGINDWRVLSIVARYPGCIATFAAEKMEVHKAIVSRAMQVLVDHGYVRLEPQGKEKLVFLTPQGKRLYEKIAKVALAREKLLLRGLSEERKAQLRTLLAHLTANVPAMNEHFARDDK
ncbi:MarR family winged helix-turn-helix transcriptional regulator [Hydrogenophaga sp. BPS33]|uniref:MarR family winged helix-turn-helix transcriptional regulator n=1 Tax=Hydrogenophaga sp. BPS33 TaxID=2651974 RepID=UPI00131FB9DB|nr:MarR family transcriptional regulator [Hydrogenophaga sp. BPS33]QHE84739.1 MarR family transcriptional regulator [Hydrogenophaga sp. BPS33]